MLDDRRLLPELRNHYHSAPVIDLDAPLEERRNVKPNPLQRPQDTRVWEEFAIAGDGRPIRLRMYSPLQTPPEGRRGLLYWIHGGGMLAGRPEGDDGLCELFAHRAGALVAAVDYRLAPEYPYPAGLQDCYEALQWLTRQGERLGFDSASVAIGGASAGGNLAVAVALMARDRGGPELFFQMPLYPMLDDRCDSPSCREIDWKAMPVSWNREANLQAWGWYLKDMPPGEVPPYAAPARAGDYRGLPPVYTCVGQLDPFRDETLDFVQRLCQDEVDVEFHLYPGAFHGYDGMPHKLSPGERMREGYVEALAEAFHRHMDEKRF